MAFALLAGNFSDGNTWDTGVEPSINEDVYANGFAVQVNGTHSVNTIRNTANPYYLGNTAVKGMTSNTLAGVGSVISNNLISTAFQVFDNNITTSWSTPANSSFGSGWIGFNFLTPKVIRRYYFRPTTNGPSAPTGWRFEGSNDGSNWATLDSQTPFQISPFTSGLLPNTTPYTFYRLFIVRSGANTINSTSNIIELEMTENPSATAIVSSQAAGGIFNLLNGSDLTSKGVVISNSTTLFIFSGTSLTSATLRANFPAGSIATSTSTIGITHSGTGTLNIIGDLIFSGASNGIINRMILNSTSTGITRITGAVASFANGSESNQQCILMTGGKLFITGTVSGGSPNITCAIINGGTSEIEITGNVNITGVTNIQSGSKVEVIGNLIHSGTGIAISVGAIPVIVRGEIIVSSTGNAIGGTSGTTLVEGNITTTSSGRGVNVTTGNVTVNGNVTITNTGIAVSTTTGAITIGKDVTASSSQNAVVSTSGLVTVSGVIYNTNQFQGVFAQRILIATTTTAIRYQTFSGATQVMFSGSAITLGLPTPNNVRLGTIYGNVPQLTGTLVLPPSNAVLVGVPIDNTVGTLVMSPAAVVAELNTSTLDIAVRLRNVSTVQTMGDQAASYGI